MKGIIIIGFAYALILALIIPSPAFSHTIVRLTTNPACDQYPAWSPDGSTIAFHSNRSGTWHIYTVPATGGNVKQLTAWPGLQGQPDYSPDGTKIAFVYMPPGGEQYVDEEIGIMPASGGSYINFTKTKGLYWQPDWSPDGKKIAFGSTRKYFNEHFLRIYIQNYPQGQAKLLFDWSWLSLQNPSWSPNGAELAFDAYTKRSTWAVDIFRISSGGGTAVNLTNTPDVIDDMPSWSPNGRYIAYANGALQGNMDLLMIPRGGGAPIRLTYDLDNDYAPAWSPDGKKIAFTSERYDNQGDICVLYLKFPGVQPTSIGKIKALYS
jgi:Tol biopolymer transport system component